MIPNKLRNFPSLYESTPLTGDASNDLCLIKCSLLGSHIILDAAEKYACCQFHLLQISLRNQFGKFEYVWSSVFLAQANKINIACDYRIDVMEILCDYRIYIIYLYITHYS